MNENDVLSATDDRARVVTQLVVMRSMTPTDRTPSSTRSAILEALGNPLETVPTLGPWPTSPVADAILNAINFDTTP